MNKYLLIYHSPASAMEKYKDMTEEETKGVMEDWMAWKERSGDGVVDFGNPVGKQTIVTLSDSKEVSDDTTGYSIIQAESLDEAKALLENHPSIKDDDGSTISLYQIHEM